MARRATGVGAGGWGVNVERASTTDDRTGDETARIVPRDFVAKLFRLDGRVAVVTGGGSGLGQAMAVGLAQAGCAVAVLDIDGARAGETARLIETDDGRAIGVLCDVRSSSSIAAAAEEVMGALGRVDALVNSAGIAFRCPAEDFPEERFDEILALNLKGTYLACQAFGRPMLAAGHGSIVNVASIGGFVAYPHASAYLASKGGVLQVTRSLALEWIDRGVRVNAIAPTLFETPLTRAGAQRSTVTSDFIRARLLRSDRLGQPAEIIGAAIFLVSDASLLVTGHTLPVDDGYLIA